MFTIKFLPKKQTSISETLKWEDIGTRPNNKDSSKSAHPVKSSEVANIKKYSRI